MKGRWLILIYATTLFSGCVVYEGGYYHTNTGAYKIAQTTKLDNCKSGEAIIEITVQDIRSSEMVCFANIDIYKDEKKIQNYLTDIEGKVKFKIEKGKYKITASSLGFSTLETKNIIVNSCEKKSLIIKIYSTTHEL